jgi:hypothetical protein
LPEAPESAVSDDVVGEGNTIEEIALNLLGLKFIFLFVNLRSA